MKKVFVCLHVLAYLCFAFVGKAQDQVHVKHLSEKDGLSYRWVFDITQDRHGFLWFATYDGLNRYDGSDFLVLRHSETDTNTISSNPVYHVMADSQDNIWTYGPNMVFNRLHIPTGRITRINTFLKNGTTWSGPIRSLLHFATLRNGKIILLYQEKNYGQCTLWQFDPLKNAFVHILDIPPVGAVRYHFTERPDGKLWIWALGSGYFSADLSTGQLIKFPVESTGMRTSYNFTIPVDTDRNFWYPSDQPDPQTNTWKIKSFTLPEDVDPNQMTYVRLDNKGNIWFNQGEDHLYCFDRDTETLRKFQDRAVRLTLEGQAMNRFFIDGEDAIWNGHFFGAIRFAHKPTLFKTYCTIPQKEYEKHFEAFSARDIIQISPSEILVKEQNHELHIIHTSTGETRRLEQRPRPGSGTYTIPGIHSMIIDKDGLLWTTQGNKLVSTDLATGTYLAYNTPRNQQENSFPRVIEDTSRTLWWCDDSGIFQFDKTAEQLDPVNVDHTPRDVGADFAHALYEPAEHVIYATYPLGVYKINCGLRNTELLQVFDPDEDAYLITAILPWDNFLWLSTNKGLVRFDPTSGERRIFTTSDGLPSNIVYSTLNHGKDLWLATHKGLCQLNPHTMQMMTYHQEQGLPFEEFNRWSYMKAQDGSLYFGGLNGIIGFHPDDINLPSEPIGHLNLVSYSKFNNKTGNPVFSQNRHFPSPTNIIVSPRERTLAFEYRLSRYADMDRIQYFHYLDGLESSWIADGTQNHVRYIQVPPGNYTLRVKALGPNALPAINELSIPVRVNQFWYLRWWALLGYGLLAMTMIGRAYQFQLKRRLDREETKRVRETNAMKMRMFTNITHEFRTPLTVILGMNSALKKYLASGDKEKIMEASALIDRNGKNLLTLVSQLLDLSKLESGLLEVNLRRGDIVAFVKYILEAFEAYAREEGIKIHFSCDEEVMLMGFDADKVSQILVNLVSNAVKYTKPGGQIEVGLERRIRSGNQYLRLRVTDTGIGMDEHALAHVFDLFYRAENAREDNEKEGSGVGLALTREIVRLMDGSIAVESKLAKGTVFTVELPMNLQAELAGLDLQALPGITWDNTSASYANPEPGSASDEKPLVLIVEDNADVSHYINISIQDQYQTMQAKNGQQGIDMATEYIPDVIISDVMMPVKDGFEMCEAIRNDERTSHIPVIMLTAKTDDLSRIEGLQHGADAYLSKPFHETELLLRISNLLALRSAVQKRYANAGHMLANSEKPDREDAFILRLRSLILDNLEDEDLSIAFICTRMHLSRTQLHRKLIALTGESTSAFIRVVQLEKAKELLSSGQYNVSEVAYKTGFKTQAHFSRVFAEALGIPPSNYQSPRPE